MKTGGTTKRRLLYPEAHVEGIIQLGITSEADMPRANDASGGDHTKG